MQESSRQPRALAAGGGRVSGRALDDGSRRFHNYLNVIALVGTFNQEKALVGTFSVIVKYSRTFV